MLIVEKLKIAKEFYFAILMDRTHQACHTTLLIERDIYCESDRMPDQCGK